MEISPKEKLFNRYSWMLPVYASKVIINDSSKQRKDIEHDLFVKMWNAIDSYNRRYQEYKRTGFYKPSPLKFYLQAAMNNRVKDLMRDNDASAPKNTTLTLHTQTCDVGVEDSLDTIVDLSNNKMILGGVDLLEGLEKHEKDCLVLHFKGMPKKILRKAFKAYFGSCDAVVDFINNKIEEFRNNDELKSVYLTEKQTYEYISTEEY